MVSDQFKNRAMKIDGLVDNAEYYHYQECIALKTGDSEKAKKYESLKNNALDLHMKMSSQMTGIDVTTSEYLYFQELDHQRRLRKMEQREEYILVDILGKENDKEFIRV